MKRETAAAAAALAVLALAAAAWLAVPRQTGSPPLALEGALEEQLATAASKEGVFRVTLPKEGHCYWVRPTARGGAVGLAVRDYNSAQACAEGFLGEAFVETARPVNVQGGCLCGAQCTLQTYEDSYRRNLKKIACR